MAYGVLSGGKEFRGTLGTWPGELGLFLLSPGAVTLDKLDNLSEPQR